MLTFKKIFWFINHLVIEEILTINKCFLIKKKMIRLKNKTLKERLFFDDFDKCIGGLNCTFIKHPPPKKLSFNQQKSWFSVKHGAYGIKFLIVVNKSA